jgi:hypothetical protein
MVVSAGRLQRHRSRHDGRAEDPIYPDGRRLLGVVVQEIGPVMTLTALATAVGFGALALSRLTAVSAICEMIAIGVLACGVHTFLFIPPVLELRHGPAVPAGSSSPHSP